MLAIYVAALCLPVYIFFKDRGGLGFLSGANPQVRLQLLFPLLGLYAFTFVTFQILITTNLRWLSRLWPSVIRYHRAQGIFALLFALLHPLFILVGFGLVSYLHYRFVAPAVHLWVLPAELALTILVLTVVTALLAWHGRNLPWWRHVHKLNYLVFILVWSHSWFIGTDTPVPLLRVVWIMYAAAIIVSTLGKYYSASRLPRSGSRAATKAVS